MVYVFSILPKNVFERFSNSKQKTTLLKLFL